MRQAVFAAAASAAALAARSPAPVASPSATVATATATATAFCFNRLGCSGCCLRASTAVGTMASQLVAQGPAASSMLKCRGSCSAGRARLPSQHVGLLGSSRAFALTPLLRDGGVLSRHRHGHGYSHLFDGAAWSLGRRATASKALVRPSHSAALAAASSPLAAASTSSTTPAAVAVESPTAAAADDAVFPEELPKAFDFLSEQRIYSWWEESGFFSPDYGRDVATAAEAQEDAFVVSMPPPNVTGALHMGHAMFVTLEDIMVRHWRMRGKPTLWLPGTDHAGIATQLVVEKMLAKEEGVKRTDLGREEFLKRVWEWKTKYGGTIGQQIRRLGASCDWSRERFTLDDQLSKAVVEAFLHLHNKGLIYRGSYMVNWSPNLQTAVSDLEVEYSEEMGTLFYLKYPVAGGAEGEHLPVATTRPETLLGDTAVAVHPEDERYKHLVGRNAVVPLSGGRQIPIIADEYVDREFGTGALKITPGHDINDYAIGQRRNLPIRNIMNRDGTLNSNAAAYSGMERFEARKKVWEDLQAQGLAIREEKRMQRVPRSQRGGEVIEPLVSRQWFVRMEPLAAPALKAVKDGDLRIIPERFEKIYNFWLEGIRDWCISRQLWWGHRIPVYYVRSRSSSSGGGNGSAAGSSNEGVSGVLAGEEAEAGEEEYVVARSEEEAMEEVRRRHGADADKFYVEQDPDVLDTWFSSGLWPFSTLGWPNTSADDFKRFYPTSVMETGHDILFFWVARMAMMGLELTGKLPFSTIYLHGLVRDSQGRKMSKSLGNVIDPLDTIAEYGTDALRFTLATGTTPGQDVNLSMERLGANKAFTNKLWNAGKFILQNLPDKSHTAAWESLAAAQFSTDEDVARLPLAERWVVSRLHEVVDEVTSDYESFDFGSVGRVVYEFFWSDFADWYIEASKTRLYTAKDNSDKDDDKDSAEAAATKSQAQAVLVYALTTVLKLLHPFMPYVTEQLWQALPHSGRTIMLAQWPTTGLPRDVAAVAAFSNVQDMIRSIRNARAEYSVEPAKKIAAQLVLSPSTLPSFEEERAVVCALARVEPSLLTISAQPPADMETAQAVHLVVAEGVEAYLPLAGMVDVAKELQRLGKQAAKLQAEVDGLNKRLGAKSFVEKAPAEVVATVQQQANDAAEKLRLLNNRLEQLRAMQ